MQCDGWSEPAASQAVHEHGHALGFAGIGGLFGLLQQDFLLVGRSEMEVELQVSLDADGIIGYGVYLWRHWCAEQ